MYAPPPTLKRCERCHQVKSDVLSLLSNRAEDGTSWRSYCKECRQALREVVRFTPKPEPKPKLSIVPKPTPKPMVTTAKPKQARQKRQVDNALKVVEAQVLRVNKRARDLYHLPDGFSLEDWQQALDYFHGCCAVCGRQGKDLFGEIQITIDHWIPMSQGGRNTPDNIIPLCYGNGGCNSTKNKTMPETWLNKKFGRHKAKKILEKVEAFFDWVVERKAA